MKDKNKKPKIIAKLKPGETKTIEGVTITANEDNTSPVYISKERNAPIVWSNSHACIYLHFDEELRLERLKPLQQND